ncbi:MAG: 16S rRNA (adenine(1518)-N(6)/adenine(1519)-N(6))-dimethyltransferase RsmA [Candidatus Pacebacteria bacterium]|nr:16S rRNA (adenine(1518)-N(6)/adenine(1519)-N(6))-dimethyltransferase RsmA [Candidatus Paceibacterota bacterium]
MGNYLGQHFLKNNSAIKRIAETLNIQPNETIIEIGPGNGELSKELVGDEKLILIEKDYYLADKLNRHFQNKNNIEIIRGDALKELPKIIEEKHLETANYKIVGNIPYYITGKLLRIIGELKIKPKLAVLMIQKEVAERIISSSPKMNLLAAATQYWSDPKIIFSLKPKDFSPAPKVDSAVIELKTKNIGLDDSKNQNYYKIVHVIFKQPRKTLFNNLRAGLGLPENDIKNALEKLNIEIDARPQNLSLNLIEKLSELLT